jgi:hypothetical protein
MLRLGDDGSEQGPQLGQAGHGALGWFGAGLYLDGLEHLSQHAGTDQGRGALEAVGFALDLDRIVGWMAASSRAKVAGALLRKVPNMCRQAAASPAHGIEQGLGVDVLVLMVVHAFLPVADAIYARYCSCANFF